MRRYSHFRILRGAGLVLVSMILFGCDGVYQGKTADDFPVEFKTSGFKLDYFGIGFNMVAENVSPMTYVGPTFSIVETAPPQPHALLPLGLFSKWDDKVGYWGIIFLSNFAVGVAEVTENSLPYGGTFSGPMVSWSANRVSDGTATLFPNAVKNASAVPVSDKYVGNHTPKDAASLVLETGGDVLTFAEGGLLVGEDATDYYSIDLPKSSSVRVTARGLGCGVSARPRPRILDLSGNPLAGPMDSNGILIPAGKFLISITSEQSGSDQVLYDLQIRAVSVK